MKSTKLASRYAKALFDLAQQRGEIETVNQDLALVKSVLKENRDFKGVIESPVIFPDKKNSIFKGVFDGKLSDTAFGFLSLIIRKKREPALGIICDEFLALYNIHHNIKIARVVTASPITPELTEILRHLLEEETHSTIQIITAVDERIIGGLMVEIDGYLYDASLLTRINRLRAEFSHNVYRAAF
ncbi:MAG: ATP synthase F1 subunit delta [Bacteroidales bacterium]|nr:ATP synthase F1 subunit delta [Bacteroidales bacterium]